MFRYATAFNQNIGSWNVDSVTDMSYMFKWAVNFNQDISAWNVSNVTDMSEMFLNAASFNQNLSRWCVENITSEPEGFAVDCPMQTGYYPVWGTCPAVNANDIDNTELFTTYPNPANTFLTVETEISGLYDIAITSLNGQLIYITKMEGSTLQIDLSFLQKGVYFITVRSRDYVRTEKIIKL